MIAKTYDSMVKRGRLTEEDKTKRMGLIRGTLDRYPRPNGFLRYLAAHPEDEARDASGDDETAFANFLHWQSGQIAGEIRVLFDPDNLRNPGKVVAPYRIDENLRLGGSWSPAEHDTFFKYPDDDGRARNIVERWIIDPRTPDAASLGRHGHFHLPFHLRGMVGEDEKDQELKRHVKHRRDREGDVFGGTFTLPANSSAAHGWAFRKTTRLK